MYRLRWLILHIYISIFVVCVWQYCIYIYVFRQTNWFWSLCTNTYFKEILNNVYVSIDLSVRLFILSDLYSQKYHYWFTFILGLYIWVFSRILNVCVYLYLCCAFHCVVDVYWDRWRWFLNFSYNLTCRFDLNFY